MAHTLPKIGYSYDALEPYIDARTMEIHHSRHHQAYVDKLNAALEKHPDLQKLHVNELLTDLSEVPKDIRQGVRNHGGGHSNHTFFWNILKKDTEFSGEIAEAIDSTFGGLKQFKEKFSSAAAGVFGSGWGWLVLHNGDLRIIGTANQDSPLSQGMTPIMGVDVWEHAYYLKYQNRRPEYLEAVFNVFNWQAINQNYVNARQRETVGVR